MEIPIFEYNRRTTRIEPRPDCVVNVDLTITSLIKLGKKQYVKITIIIYIYLSLFIYI